MKKSLWRNGYTFALIMLILVGICLIIIGSEVFTNGTSMNEILIGIGISMGPAAIVASLFRYFLFQEVQYQLTEPVIDEIKGTLSPEINSQIKNLLGKYNYEIDMLKVIREAGIVRPYRTREYALKKFIDEIQIENNEIYIIGSSLKGLLQQEDYKDVRIEIEKKIKDKIKVRFLLTHPMVADLRAEQEGRSPQVIGKEIIESLKILKNWNVEPDNIKLYKGTPTCFAIKTSKVMLLNNYPYGEVAYDSPCVIVEKFDDNSGYFFTAYEKSHFGVWDKDTTEEITDLAKTIQDLNAKMKVYSEKVRDLLKT